MELRDGRGAARCRRGGRRRARRERDEIVTNARKEAERILDRLRDEVRAVRESLQREVLTVDAIDEAHRARRGPGRRAARRRRGAGAGPAAVAARVAPRRPGSQPDRRLGGPDRGPRARRDASVARGRRDPGHGRRRRPRPGRWAVADGGRRRAAERRVSVDRSRSVAASLDLRGARVDEALDALDRYLDEASVAGPPQGPDHPRAGDRGAPRRGPPSGGRPTRS